MKRICLLFCGGTFSMVKNKQTGTLDVINGAEQIFELEPRISDLAKIEVVFIDNINSTNATPALRERVGAKIDELYDDYDGFVITTGTDTMAYMSSALSYSLQNIGKPVVLTGAQIPLENISSDGRANLINALKVSLLELGGVFLVFGSKIILGGRAQKVGESDLQAFESYNAPDFGSIGIGIKLNTDSHVGHTQTFELKNGFDPNIMVITITPGISCEQLIGMLDLGVHGVIIKGYGTGDVPTSIFPFLEEAQRRCIPVIQSTQCKGSTILGIYSLGLEALRRGVIESYDMSLESITTKLMRALAQGVSYDQMKTFMHTDIHGEVSDRKARYYRVGDIQMSIEQIFEKK